MLQRSLPSSLKGATLCFPELAKNQTTKASKRKRKVKNKESPPNQSWR